MHHLIFFPSCASVFHVVCTVFHVYRLFLHVLSLGSFKAHELKWKLSSRNSRNSSAARHGAQNESKWHTNSVTVATAAPVWYFFCFLSFYVRFTLIIAVVASCQNQTEYNRNNFPFNNNNLAPSSNRQYAISTLELNRNEVEWARKKNNLSFFIPRILTALAKWLNGEERARMLISVCRRRRDTTKAFDYIHLAFLLAIYFHIFFVSLPNVAAVEIIRLRVWPEPIQMA